MEKQVCFNFNNKTNNRKMPEKLKRRSPFLIGVAGGTASGKSTVCEKIMENLRQIHQVGWMSLLFGRVGRDLGLKGK